MTNLRRAVTWARANVEYAPVAAFVAIVVYVWVAFPSLFVLLKLGLVILLAIGATVAYVVLRDGPTIARAAAAKKLDTPLPARTVRAYEVEPPHRAVPQLPVSTYVMEPVTPAPIDLDDPNVVIPMPPPLPPSTAKVTVVPGRPVEWPLLRAERVDFTQPIPVGYDELGNIVYVKLDQRTLLIAAEMGWGKSTIIHMLTAAAALDPRVRLTVIDVKLVTMTRWKGCAERWVGDDISEANRVLTKLRGEMRRRYAYMSEHHLELLRPSDVYPLEVLIVDELETLTDDDAFVANLVDITRLGRAAGIIVIAATQEPRADVIPKKLTNKFVFRWAGRCADVAQTRMVIGARYRQAPAHLLDAADKGLGYLMHEGAEPVKLQAFYLTESDIRDIAERAEVLRRSGPRSASEAPPKRRASDHPASVDEALRGVNEALRERIRGAITEGWSDYRIARELLGAGRGGDELVLKTAVVKAIRTMDAAPGRPLRIVRDAEEAGEEA